MASDDFHEAIETFAIVEKFHEHELAMPMPKEFTDIDSV